ncbi:MAG: NUDIX hydrolase [Treponema sp.]|nr:NUDIX hydrolase [Treponema sp.]
MSTQQNTDSALLWTQGKAETLLTTPVLTVTQVPATSSDGLHGDYIVMDAKDWCIVIPDTGRSFLLVKQWRHGERALSIEFPGGVIEKGEEPEKAAARELLEETGCKAGKLTHLGTMNPNPALMSNHIHVFLAEELTDTGCQNLDKDEYVTFFERDKKEVLRNMGSKEYPHALMSAALMLYMQHTMLHDGQ